MSRIHHWTFRTIPSDLANTANWRKVDFSFFSDSEISRFRRLKSAIEAYVTTGKLRAISAETGVSESEIIRLLNRCLAVATDGNLVGWPALISGFRIANYNRVNKMPSGLAGTSNGFAGAFTAFLRKHPKIKEHLDTLILKRKKKGVMHEAKISAKKLHATFVALCKDAGVSNDEYPLNSRSCAKRSIARYMNDVLESNIGEGTSARYGSVASSHLNVGTGYPPHLLSTAPFDLVGLDPHELHCFGTVRVNGPAGPQRIAIERLWIVPVLENECRVILGYSVGIRTECSAATVESALISSMSLWQPRKPKIPGVTYLPNAGLPSGLFPELVGCGWVTLTIDNAAIHYARAVAERARKRIGCFLTYGALGHWEHRAVLERLMKTLEIYGFQRLPSSTGSSSKDPTRTNPVKNAIDSGIDWEDLLDLVDVILANYNATGTESLGNRTPLNALRDHLHCSHPTFFPRHLPEASFDQPELGVSVERKCIRGNKIQGRRPYIELDRVRYTSPLLASSMALIGKFLIVHIRESNYCTVTAYYESGEELGVLTAAGAWARTPHTREMRKQINALRDAGDLILYPGQDPIEAMMQYYASKAHHDAEKNPLKVSKAATKLTNAAYISGLKIPEVNLDVPIHLKPKTPPTETLSRLVKKPMWKTIIS